MLAARQMRKFKFRITRFPGMTFQGDELRWHLMMECLTTLILAFAVTHISKRDSN